MRPPTVHALAQGIRHTRGLLATLDKWIATTPPEQVATELTAAIGVIRGALQTGNTVLSRSRSSTAPDADDRPRSARRRGRPINGGPWGPY